MVTVPNLQLGAGRRSSSVAPSSQESPRESARSVSKDAKSCWAEASAEAGTCEGSSSLVPAAEAQGSLAEVLACARAADLSGSSSSKAVPKLQLGRLSLSKLHLPKLGLSARGTRSPSVSRLQGELESGDTNQADCLQQPPLGAGVGLSPRACSARMSSPRRLEPLGSKNTEIFSQNGTAEGSAAATGESRAGGVCLREDACNPSADCEEATTSAINEIPGYANGPSQSSSVSPGIGLEPCRSCGTDRSENAGHPANDGVPQRSRSSSAFGPRGAAVAIQRVACAARAVLPSPRLLRSPRVPALKPLERVEAPVKMEPAASAVAPAKERTVRRPFRSSSKTETAVTSSAPEVASEAMPVSQRVEGIHEDVTARQIVNLVYERSVDADTANTVVMSCPEIAWIAKCALKAPQPLGWRRVNIPEAGFRYVNEERGTTSQEMPMLPCFARMAKVVIQARQHPDFSENSAAWIRCAREDALREALRLQEGWSGPFTDPASGADYYYHAATLKSSWESPAIAHTYVAHVAHNLLQSDLFLPSAAKERNFTLDDLAQEILRTGLSAQSSKERSSSTRKTFDFVHGADGCRGHHAHSHAVDIAAERRRPQSSRTSHSAHYSTQDGRPRQHRDGDESHRSHSYSSKRQHRRHSGSERSDDCRGHDWPKSRSERSFRDHCSDETRSSRHSFRKHDDRRRRNRSESSRSSHGSWSCNSDVGGCDSAGSSGSQRHRQTSTAGSRPPLVKARPSRPSKEGSRRESQCKPTCEEFAIFSEANESPVKAKPSASSGGACFVPAHAEVLLAEAAAAVAAATAALKASASAIPASASGCGVLAHVGASVVDDKSFFDDNFVMPTVPREGCVVDRAPSAPTALKGGFVLAGSVEEAQYLDKLLKPAAISSSSWDGSSVHPVCAESMPISIEDSVVMEAMAPWRDARVDEERIMGVRPAFELDVQAPRREAHSVEMPSAQEAPSVEEVSDTKEATSAALAPQVTPGKSPAEVVVAASAAHPATSLRSCSPAMAESAADASPPTVSCDKPATSATAERIVTQRIPPPPSALPSKKMPAPPNCSPPSLVKLDDLLGESPVPALPAPAAVQSPFLKPPDDLVNVQTKELPPGPFLVSSGAPADAPVKRLAAPPKPVAVPLASALPQLPTKKQESSSGYTPRGLAAAGASIARGSIGGC